MTYRGTVDQEDRPNRVQLTGKIDISEYSTPYDWPTGDQLFFLYPFFILIFIVILYTYYIYTTYFLHCYIFYTHFLYSLSYTGIIFILTFVYCNFFTHFCVLILCTKFSNFLFLQLLKQCLYTKYGPLSNTCGPLLYLTHAAHYLTQDKQTTQPNLPIISMT